jgi:hypothetical protein
MDEHSRRLGGKSWEKWEALDEALRQLFEDAFYAAGYHHVIWKYADGEDDTPHNNVTIRNEFEGLEALLDDMGDDLKKAKRALKEYAKANR